MPKNSVLFSSRAPVGYVAIAANPISTNQGFKSLVPATGINSEYLFYYLKSSKDLAEQHASGTTFLELSARAFSKFPAPIAPLNEQKRIVEKLELLLSELDKATQALQAAQEKLKNYRRAVLKAAVEGELSRAWREENREGLEPADRLLERILAERRKKWEEDELAKMRAKGKEPKDDKWKEKYKEPEGVDSRGLPELPEGWEYVTVQHLTFNDKAAMKTGPFGTLMGKGDYRESGVPIVGIENIGELEFIEGFSKFVDSSKFESLNTYEVSSGDILISRSGTVGEICVFPGNQTVAIMSTNLIRVRVNQNAVDPHFFIMLFKGSPLVLNQVNELCKGSTRVFLNQTILSSLIFPLPSLEEQRKILKEVDEHFSYADELDAVTGVSSRRSDKLRQSLLKKAFSGLLVPQDPNDEPASVLLERIRAEREAAAAAGRKGKRGEAKGSTAAEQPKLFGG